MPYQKLNRALVNLNETKAAFEATDPSINVFKLASNKVSSFFSLLRELRNIQFEVLIYRKNVKRLIKFSALDYLHILSKIADLLEMSGYSSSPNELCALGDVKIALGTGKKTEVFSVKEVVRCQSKANHTIIHVLGKSSPIEVAKNLKQCEADFSKYKLMRVHSCHLINLDHVKDFTSDNGPFKNNIIITMTDGTKVPVSRGSRKAFLKNFIMIR